MSGSDACKPRSNLCPCSMVLVLLALLVCGCSVRQSCLEDKFPADLVLKARADFKIDLTDWDVPAGWTVPTRGWVDFRCEGGVDGEVQRYCQQKVQKCLEVRGFHVDSNEPAQLAICVVKAAEIRKPVRSAKVRIAVKFSTAGGAGPAMVGIADGIEPRPDLSSGVWMPKAAYCRAAQYAIAKLMDQLDNVPKRTQSQ